MSQSSSSPLPLYSLWQDLPQAPGIYIYKDVKGKLLYVGKAKNLRSRVHSYTQDPAKLGPKTSLLVSLIHTLEHIEVGSEIEALFLESRLIKKFKPPYNIAAKDDKSPYYIHITKEEFPKPILNHEPNGAVAGPFLNSQVPRRILRQFRHIAPYCTAKRPVKRACFYSHLGLCHPCPATGDKINYRKNITKLKSLFKGEFSHLKSQLTREMAQYSKSLEYEQAGNAKKALDNLEFLLHQPVSPDEYIENPNLIQDTRLSNIESLRSLLSPYLDLPNVLNRIEMYDIANLQGTAATSAMTVAIAGEPNTKYYRHFTIRTKDTPDDVAMMKETLTRRLKREDWPKPDLIVLDGGKSQLSIIKDLPQEFLAVPVIGLAKKDEIITIPQNNGEFIEIKAPLDNLGLRLLQRLRDEAHRFSRRLHHKHRSKQLISS